MSLHETAARIRKLIVLGAIGLSVLAVLVVSFNALRNWWLRIHPPPEPPPTYGFGKLPELQLPSITFEGDPSFHLETATGKLPNLPEQAEIVAMRGPQQSLLGEQRAKDLADSLDFGDDGELSTDKKSIVFRDTTDKRTLTVDLSTQNFTLSTELSHIQNTVPRGSALTSSEAIQEAQKFLNRNGLLGDDFGGGVQTTQLHQVVNGKAEVASSLSGAQFTRVDFYRNLTEVSADSFAMLPPNPKIGLIQVWVTSGLKPQINNTLYVSYTVWELDKEKVETYPLRSVSSAWEEVQEGKGVAEILVEKASALNPNTNVTLSTITIRSVRLAYFDDDSFQSYLQPIFVFSGEATTTSGEETDFTAYRPAVSDEWVEE
jgi:hypothetical protein